MVQIFSAKLTSIQIYKTLCIKCFFLNQSEKKHLRGLSKNCDCKCVENKPTTFILKTSKHKEEEQFYHIFSVKVSKVLSVSL